MNIIKLFSKLINYYSGVNQNDGGKDESLRNILKFTNLKIPLTACRVNRPYSYGNNEWSKMDFDQKFSEPEK